MKNTQSNPKSKKTQENATQSVTQSVTQTLLDDLEMYEHLKLDEMHGEFEAFEEADRGITDRQYV